MANPNNPNAKGGLLPFVRDLYEAHGLDAVWAWGEGGKGAHNKAKRFGAAAHFAGNRKQQPQAGDPNWDKVQKRYRDERDKWEKRYEERHADKAWPQSLVIAERLYHYPGPHFHLASPERNKLIAICGIIEEDCRVGEFPPFDTVEDVHTGPSWHYRNPASPYVPVAFNAAHLQEGGDWGCAADINDWDQGNDEEYGYYIEVGRRYA